MKNLRPMYILFPYPQISTQIADLSSIKPVYQQERVLANATSLMVELLGPLRSTRSANWRDLFTVLRMPARSKGN